MRIPSPLADLVFGQGLTIWIVDAKGASSKLTVPLAYYFQRLGAQTLRNEFTGLDFRHFVDRRYDKVSYPADVKYLLLGMTDSDKGATFKLIDCERRCQISIAEHAEKYLEHRQRKPHDKAAYLGEWLEKTLLRQQLPTRVTN